MDDHEVINISRLAAPGGGKKLMNGEIDGMKAKTKERITERRKQPEVAVANPLKLCLPAVPGDRR